jgi:hypothetical protein
VDFAALAARLFEPVLCIFIALQIDTSTEFSVC